MIEIGETYMKGVSHIQLQYAIQWKQTSDKLCLAGLGWSIQNQYGLPRQTRCSTLLHPIIHYLIMLESLHVLSYLLLLGLDPGFQFSLLVGLVPRIEILQCLGAILSTSDQF